MSRLPTLAAATALLLLFPDLAAAHTGGMLGGFGAGLAHPLTGLDHALAIATFGALAAQVGGNARWIVPTSFVAAMLVGGAMGTGGAILPAVELFIALSVPAGGLVLADARLRSTAVLATVALFAAGVALVDRADQLADGRAGRVIRLGGGAVAAVGLVLLVIAV